MKLMKHCCQWGKGVAEGEAGVRGSLPSAGIGSAVWRCRVVFCQLGGTRLSPTVRHCGCVCCLTFPEVVLQ